MTSSNDANLRIRDGSLHPTDAYEFSNYPVHPNTPEPSYTAPHGHIALNVHESASKSSGEVEESKKWWWNKHKSDSKSDDLEHPKNVTFKQLFRFRDRKDNWLMLLGGLCACISGAALPAFSFIFGRLMNELADKDADLLQKVSELSLYMTIIGLGTWVLTAVGVACFSVAGDRQVRIMRRTFFAAILDQEVAFFDTSKAGELTSRISSDVQIVSTLLGSKLSMLITYLSTFVLAYVFAFIQSWELTLVMLGVSPLLAISGAIMAKLLSSATKQAQEVYACAGGIAQEVLSAIRTVQAFDGMARECDRYNEQTHAAQNVGIKKGLFMGLAHGTTMCILFCSYAIAFFFGSYLIEWERNTPGEVVAVFFAVLIGAFQLGAAGPIFTSIAEARGAAFKVYEIIDRVPAMDTKENGKGQVITSVTGKVEFRNISFTYPARPDLPIFENFNLRIEPGQRVALVGPSGSGKSSIVALLERFYDPDHGEVLIDDVSLPMINLFSWRKQVGIVTQEPTLFQATVMENIRCANPSATEEEVIQACKDAFIHDVISKLPDGYNTVVGESGSQLSGGQKQRVAIARAIVKNPKLLLLDEATSALDRQSEAIVQEALKNVMRNRTVVTIAHRLVTIQDSDLICYIEPRDPTAPADSPAHTSRLLESGTHEELMRLNGQYCAMVYTQNQSAQYQAEAVGADTGDASRLSEMLQMEEQPPPELAEPTATPEKKSIVRRTARLSAGDGWYLAFGVIAAAVAGVTYPVYAIIFSEVINVFYQDNMRSQVWWWCLLFVALGVMNFVCYTVKIYCLNRCGEQLTYRLRCQLFQSITSQDIGFFDMPGNESGALCSRLSSDTTEIQHLWGGAIGANVQAAVCLIGGMIVALVVSWELALVVLATVPVVVIAGYYNNKLMFNLFKESGRDLEKAGQVANESITGHRTVFAFNMQQAQVTRYDSLLTGPAKAASKKALLTGFFLGFSQFIIFGVFALALWYGGVMIDQGRQTFNGVLKCSMAVLMGAIGVGEVYSMAGDQAGARNAATRVYELMDRVPPIDALGDEGIKLDAIRGEGEFRDVGFAYPSRPTVPVLQHLNLSFQEGQRIAIMGSTGCGKSTIISLLMRYYDPTAGEVRPEHTPLTTLNLRSWRHHLGLVSQEPTLFDTSIANNIKYGKPDATDEEMYEAARKAHIHDTILSLPEGYSTNVGAKGSQLSGGQKQRVAIARCIIRKPTLLLLDEATSALDNVSEREVQAALDAIILQERMTVITVAHRLSTIKNSNVIVIMHEGRVLEMGSHEQLYALGGDYTRRYNQYYNLHQAS